MNRLLNAWYIFLQKPLNLGSRVLLLIGAVLVAAAIFFPLWRVYLVAPQYQEGLEMIIYSYKFEGGHDGQDLKEINMLNHYIGMKTVSSADFIEMQLFPFMFGLFVLLSLRAAVFGQMSAVVDLLVLTSYFGMFSAGSFVYRLYTYGHNLDPHAPMNIDPFMPVVIGTQQVANFTQSSYPELGTYLICIFVLLMVVAIWLSRKEHVPPSLS